MSNANQFLTALTIAIANCSLYAKDNELIEEAAKKTFSMLDELLKDRVEMMIIDDDLIINKTPMRDSQLHSAKILKLFKQKDISRIEFLKGLTVGELQQFIVNLSKSDTDIQISPHIKAGIVGIGSGGSGTGAQSIADLSAEDVTEFRDEQVEKLKVAFHSISPFKKLTMSDLEEIVARFVATISKEMSILKLLSPVKSYSNYTYVHSINVAVLSIFQAESLGIRGRLLHDIGLSALLHDVGKLFISKDILEKKGALDEKEFAEITKHPSFGAAYLAKVENITRIAPLVAFEHHRKFNGAGYPTLSLQDKHPHIASQIVSIADVFDALRSWRPYRKSLETKEVLVLMKKNAGTDFNPLLVDNFTRAFLKATSKDN
ncbi:HD domain-containing protein [bacterium]|nr:MAG: HD domain-containing protein [bacterium]